MLFPGHIENINIILDTNNMGVLTYSFTVIYFYFSKNLLLIINSY